MLESEVERQFKDLIMKYRTYISLRQTSKNRTFKCQQVFLTVSFLHEGIAAATMFMSKQESDLSDTQLRVAFDGDAVLFSDESEIIVKKHGLDTFFEHEKEFENKPLAQVKRHCHLRATSLIPVKMRSHVFLK